MNTAQTFDNYLGKIEELSKKHYSMYKSYNPQDMAAHQNRTSCSFKTSKKPKK